MPFKARQEKRLRPRAQPFCHHEGVTLFLCPEGTSRAEGEGRLCDCTAVPLYALTSQLCLRRHTFFCLARKKYAKKRRRTRNSAYARKGVSLDFTCYRYTGGQGTPFGRRPHKLHIPRFHASVKARPFRCSSFPKHKRFAGLCFGFLRVPAFVPVEYLTYGSRKRCRVFRLPRRAAVYASLSRFIDLEYAFAQTKFREKSKKGASALFLVVLRGIAKAGLPREPSEAVRAGKGGTTERTRFRACAEARELKFVPTQLPLCHSFFRPSTALSFSCEKESGVETFPAHSVRG